MIPTRLGVAIISFRAALAWCWRHRHAQLAGDGGQVDEKVLQQERGPARLDKPIAHSS